MPLPNTLHPVYPAATPDIIRNEIRQAVQQGRPITTLPTRADQQSSYVIAPMAQPTSTTRAPIAQTALTAPPIIQTSRGRSGLFDASLPGALVPGTPGNVMPQATPVEPSTPMPGIPGSDPLIDAANVAKRNMPTILFAVGGLGAGLLTAYFIWGR